MHTSNFKGTALDHSFDPEAQRLGAYKVKLPPLIELASKSPYPLRRPQKEEATVSVFRGPPGIIITVILLALISGLTMGLIFWLRGGKESFSDWIQQDY